MRILRDDDLIEKSLRRKDVKKINDCKRQSKVVKETFQAETEHSDVTSDITIKQIENNEKVLKARAREVKSRVANMNLKSKLASSTRKCNFLETLNDAAEKEVDALVLEGRKLNILSTLFAVLSAITTCVGIIDTNFLLLWLFKCIWIVIGAVGVNKIIKNFNTYRLKFYDFRDTYSKAIFYAMLGIIIAYTTYSVITNYSFWKMARFDVIGAGILSVLFDAVSIVFAFLSDGFRYLEYNKKYIDNILETDTDISIDSEERKENVMEHEKDPKNESSMEITSKQRQSVEFPEVDVIEEEEENMLKSSVLRTGNSKVSREIFENRLDGIEEDTVITPKVVGMVGNKNYYNWIRSSQKVVKNKDGKYVKAESKEGII